MNFNFILFEYLIFKINFKLLKFNFIIIFLCFEKNGCWLFLNSWFVFLFLVI